MIVTTELPYTWKFLRYVIFMDFMVDQVTVKIQSVKIVDSALFTAVNT